MKNPIPSTNLFVTLDLDELKDALDNNFTGREKAIAWQVAMMVFNTCHKLIEDEVTA